MSKKQKILKELKARGIYKDTTYKTKELDNFLWIDNERLKAIEVRK